MLRIALFIAFMLCQPITNAATEATKDKGLVSIPNSSTYELKSNILGRTYPIYVSVPNGYSPASEKKYPLVLINDGPYAFPIAASALEMPMRSGVIENVILVGIGFSKGDNMMLSRIRDYTPSVDPNWQQFKPGQAKQYLDFIASELLPFIEKKYAVDSERRTLVGHSAGGLFSSFVLLNHPKLFESYLVLSPALFWHEKLMFKQEESFAKNHRDLKARVYFSVGTDETSAAFPFKWQQDLQAFVKQLANRNYPNLLLKEEVIDGGLHETTYPIGLIKGIQWLYSK